MRIVLSAAVSDSVDHDLSEKCFSLFEDAVCVCWLGEDDSVEDLVRSFVMKMAALRT